MHFTVYGPWICFERRSPHVENTILIKLEIQCIDVKLYTTGYIVIGWFDSNIRGFNSNSSFYKFLSELREDDVTQSWTKLKTTFMYENCNGRKMQTAIWWDRRREGDGVQKHETRRLKEQRRNKNNTLEKQNRRGLRSLSGRQVWR